MALPVVVWAHLEAVADQSWRDPFVVCKSDSTQSRHFTLGEVLQGCESQWWQPHADAH